MNTRLIANILLAALIIGAVFGLYLPMMSHAGHEAGCPFTPGGTAVCTTPLAHLKHWQSAFAAVLADILILLAFAFFSIRAEFFKPPERQIATFAVRKRGPERPTLMQELFSDGILNCKESYYIVVRY